MAGIIEKLYPPIIGDSIPACYKNDNGTVVITVPFSMNRAVDSSVVGGFKLKIKTVQSNTYIKTLDVDSTTQALNSRIATFSWYDFDDTKVKIGQYLKIQMAYVGKDNVNAIGYFSTVGIIKYTSKPNVYIEGIGKNVNQIEAFKQSYTGVFETGEDKSERPYSYNFYLYDKYGNLIETTGWTLHNTSINNIASESLSLDKATDTYTFQTLINADSEYYLQYGVRTINNLEVFSPIYTCIEPYIGPSEFYMNLTAENNYEEAYINLSLDMKTDEELLSTFHGDYVITNNIENTKSIYQYNPENENNNILITTVSYEIPASPVSIEICRAELTDNFSSWRTLQKVYFSDYATALNWSFKDLTIEQGITYRYCYRQYNKAGIQSSRTYSNDICADFEDMFLWDGKRQLKIRYNPKVSSFKTNHLEQKTDTIGSKYPFFFRNSIVEYREFPISGLISYLADNNEMFINHEEDLNIVLGPHAYRKDGTPINQNNNDVEIGKSWEISQTLDSIGYNMRAERLFKMKLLDWLGNGEIKMFKSPAEGNYLVRLMNISLTPEDKVGRMLHNFSATAYEVEDLTYQNLIDLNFIIPTDEITTNLAMETVLLRDKIDTISNINNSVLINNYTIKNYLYLSPSTNVVGGPGFYVRLGEDIVSQKTYIQPGFVIKSDNSTLPSVWFNIADNYDILDELGLSRDINGAKSLVGDAVLTYQYNRTSVITGELYNIENVYVSNEIKTIIGPAYNNFTIQQSNDQEEEVLKFYVLNFKRKPIREIAIQNNNYIDIDTGMPITTFDKLSLYKVQNTENYYYVNGNSLISMTAPEQNITIRLVNTNNEEKIFTEIPILALNEDMYSVIEIGSAVYLECAYQKKVTTYKVG